MRRKQVPVMQEVAFFQFQDFAGGQFDVRHGDVFFLLAPQSVAEILCIEGVPPCPCQDELDGIVLDGHFALFENSLDECAVAVFPDLVQGQGLCAGIEGAVRIVEHLAEHSPAASGKKEDGVAHSLHLRPEEGFDVLFGVVGDLLEFVDGDDGFLMLVFQELEQGFQGALLLLLRIEVKGYLRGTGQRIEGEYGAESFQDLHEPFSGRGFLREGSENRFGELIDEFVQVQSGVNIRIQGRISFGLRFLQGVEDQSRFSVFTGGVQGRVHLVPDVLQQCIGLRLPVAEILFGPVSSDDKWVEGDGHGAPFSTKIGFFFDSRK